MNLAGRIEGHRSFLLITTRPLLGSPVPMHGQIELDRRLERVCPYREDARLRELPVPGSHQEQRPKAIRPVFAGVQLRGGEHKGRHDESSYGRYSVCLLERYVGQTLH